MQDFVKGLFYIKFRVLTLLLFYCLGLYAVAYYLIYKTIDYIIDIPTSIDLIVRDVIAIVVVIFFSLVVRNFGRGVEDGRKKTARDKKRSKRYSKKN